MSTEYKINITIYQLPHYYPQTLFDCIYQQTGKELDAEGLTSQVTTFDVWYALRSMHEYFSMVNKSFHYTESFRLPEVYQPNEVIEHIRKMLSKHLEGMWSKRGGRELTWDVIAEENGWLEIFLIAVDSFIDAIQGANVAICIEQRLERIYREQEKRTKEFIMSVMNLARKMMPFSDEQIRWMSRHFSTWGPKKSRAFFNQFIVPKLQDDPERTFSDQELLAFIASFSG